MQMVSTCKPRGVNSQSEFEYPVTRLELSPGRVEVSIWALPLRITPTIFLLLVLVERGPSK